MYTTKDFAHTVRHQMAHGLFAGVQIFIPQRGCGANGSENWVHLVQHLSAKCKQTEMRSSPTTGAAVSKNNSVEQQLRNLAQMVTSATELY